MLRQARHLLLVKHSDEMLSDGYVAMPFACEDIVLKDRLESLDVGKVVYVQNAGYAQEEERLHL